MLHYLCQDLLLEFLKVVGRQVEGCNQLAGEVWRWNFVFVEIPVELFFEDGVLIDGDVNVNGSQFFVFGKSPQAEFRPVGALFFTVLLRVLFDEKGQIGLWFMRGMILVRGREGLIFWVGGSFSDLMIGGYAALNLLHAWSWEIAYARFALIIGRIEWLLVGWRLSEW